MNEKRPMKSVDFRFWSFSLFDVLIYLLLELIFSGVFCSAGGEGTAVFLALIFIGIFAQQGGGHCCSAGQFSSVSYKMVTFSLSGCVGVEFYGILGQKRDHL